MASIQKAEGTEDLLPDAVLKIETVAAFFDDANSTD